MNRPSPGAACRCDPTCCVLETTRCRTATDGRFEPRNAARTIGTFPTDYQTCNPHVPNDLDRRGRPPRGPDSGASQPVFEPAYKLASSMHPLVSVCYRYRPAMRPIAFSPMRSSGRRGGVVIPVTYVTPPAAVRAFRHGRPHCRFCTLPLELRRGTRNRGSATAGVTPPASLFHLHLGNGGEDSGIALAPHTNRPRAVEFRHVC